jgi:carbon storage regulator
MLVLSRKRGETIVVGSDIRITVVEIRGDKVKLGFVGPNQVPIHREEVYRRIQEESHPTTQDSLRFADCV